MRYSSIMELLLNLPKKKSDVNTNYDNEINSPECAEFLSLSNLAQKMGPHTFGNVFT